MRSSRFASIFSYEHNPAHAPSGAADKRFELDVVVVTTSGRWELHGNDGKHDIDSSSLAVGASGDEYACTHDPQHVDSNLIAGLDAKAVDPDCRPLFRRQVVPSLRSLNLVKKAVQAEDDDDFDTLIFSVFDLASEASYSDARASNRRLRMQRAKRFIEQHAFEGITVERIARELALSPFTILREYRRAFGKTPHSYLQELRLERAKDLLARSDLEIGGISHVIGVTDQGYFSRLFKNATGLSPSQYRTIAKR